jgi:hypothetical protein
MRSVILGVMAAIVAMGGGLVQAQIPAGAMRTAYTVEPFAPGGQVTIQGTGVRLRAEPFATGETPVLSSGSTGLPLNVVGIARLPDWNWYQVVLKNGQKAFIRSDYTSAPSKGGGPQAAPLPAPTRIDYGSAPAPAATRAPDPISLTPAPAPAIGPAQPAAPAGSAPLDGAISLRPASPMPAAAAPLPPPAQTTGDLIPDSARSSNTDGLTSR